MTKAVIDVSYVNLTTNNHVKIWWTPELIQHLKVSLATFKRDREILICEVPEFGYSRYAKTYNDFQRHCLEVVRDWRRDGLDKLEIIQKLRKEGIAKYE
ncbi:hypothetical protein CAL7716_085840 [Calothrix sp. PCC 7716]|nr:hypothetical protein CAL7716_085840 [Calothrix sp. PCC 7716]